MAAHYEQPYVQFYQIEFDSGQSILAPMQQVGGEVQNWVRSLNIIYREAKRDSRIRFAESSSWIDPEVYERLFKSLGFRPQAQRTVFRWGFEVEEARR